MIQFENMLTKNNLVYGAMTIFGYMVILFFPINLLFVYILGRAHLRSSGGGDILEGIQHELNDLYQFSQKTCHETAKFVKNKIEEYKNRNSESSSSDNIDEISIDDSSQSDNGSHDVRTEADVSADIDEASNEVVNGDGTSDSNESADEDETMQNQAQVVDGE